MTLSRQTLCAVYALIGLFALVGTWGNNIHYLGLGFLAANAHFWDETLINAASRSITVDLLFLTLAAAVWMLLEARRLRMRFVWLYLFFGIVIAISVTFPAFLIHRERVIAGTQDGAAGALSGADVAGLIALAAVCAAYAAFTLLP